MTQIPRQSEFQIHAFNENAWAIRPESDGVWLDGGDAEVLDKAMEQVRQSNPIRIRNKYVSV